MLIVLGLYALVVWLIFSKFGLLPWNKAWKTTVYTVAFLIALVVIGALNTLTPTGRVSVQGAMIGMTPNVAGTVTEVAIKPNEPIAKGDVLFRIDDTTFTAEVARLEASLISARTVEAQLKTDLQAAEAEIERLAAQLKFGFQRRDDIVRLAERGASTGFQMQEAVSNIEQLEASLRGAQARKASIKTRIASQIDGVDSGVAEVEQMLVQARWNLDQTVIRAPNDGIVTALTLRPGNRVTTLKAAMSFFQLQDRVMTVTFPQSSTHGVQVGDVVRVAMRTIPGAAFKTTVVALPLGIGEGTVDARDGLPTLRELAGGSEYVAVLEIPNDLEEQALRLGSSGTALRITDDAGGIAVLAEILFWITKMMNYL
jgi:multidrug resistance efflux pump